MVSKPQFLGFLIGELRDMASVCPRNMSQAALHHQPAFHPGWGNSCFNLAVCALKKEIPWWPTSWLKPAPNVRRYFQSNPWWHQTLPTQSLMKRKNKGKQNLQGKTNISNSTRTACFKYEATSDVTVFQPLPGEWERESEYWHTWIKTLQSQKIQS